MVSDREKKRAEAKKAKAAGGKMSKAASSASLAKTESTPDLANLNINEADDSFSSRTVTGVLASRPTARDIKIVGFSMGLNGVELIQDCSIELTIGRRYGLLGQNGCGKSNFLKALANREVPIPDHLDIYVSSGAHACDHRRLTPHLAPAAAHSITLACCNHFSASHATATAQEVARRNMTRHILCVLCTAS